MLKLVVVRLFLLAFIIMMAIILIHILRPTNPPEPAMESTGAPSCVVSEEAAKVHSGEKGFENAWIQFVNDDNTVQVQTVETKLVILFELKLKPQDVVCFHEEWITPVTIEECVKDSGGQCNFKLPHTVYVASRPVNVVAWKYLESAF